MGAQPVSETPAIVLPALEWKPSANYSTRHGLPVSLVVVHRWGVRLTGQAGERATYEAVVAYLRSPASKVSAHIVFPGSAVPGQATQLVGWDSMAWAEAAYNGVADEVESADAIWLGDDAEGLAVLARIVADRLHVRGLPPAWSHRKGFCRHADLGAAGGGHLECPTTDLTLWRHFCTLVEREHSRAGFRPVWGRS